MVLSLSVFPTLERVATISSLGSSSPASPRAVPVLQASEAARIKVEAGGREVWQQSASRFKGQLVSNCGGAPDEEQLADAVEKLERLVKQGSVIDSSLFFRAIKRCVVQKDLNLGSRIHALCLQNGCESNTFLANHIIRMYGCHGKLQEAKDVFRRVAAPDTFMWASIISAHIKNGEPAQAVKLYRQMQYSGAKPNSYVYVAALKACVAAMDLESGKAIHTDIVQGHVDLDVFIGTCLVDMYAKCGSLVDACRVFDNLTSKNVVTWTAMIAGYAHHGLGQEALALYASMLREGITPADRVTFLCLLQACATTGDLQQGKLLHSQIQEKGLEASLGTTLVDMYSKCGSLDDARRVFDSLPTRKDVVTWTAMIGGYAQHGRGHEALALRASMQQDGVTPNRVTFLCLLQGCASVQAVNEGKQLHLQIQRDGLQADVVMNNCLMDMYAKCGCLDDARNVFDELRIKDVVSWTTMIRAYAQYELGEEALLLYARMQDEGFIPADKVTFACLLQVCAGVGALSKGRQLHVQIQESGLLGDVVVASCLVDMYAKCGALLDARDVFDRLPTKNEVTWTAMIAGYVQHGRGQDALALFAIMQEVDTTPVNCVTFVCLLQACACIGALHHGKKLHAQIQLCSLESDMVVANSLITMYFKCGSVDDARRVFDSLPAKDIVTWTAMISGYVQHDLGSEALAMYNGMQQDGISPSSRVTFVCLLQACARVGALRQGRQLHSEIEQSGLDADVVIGNCLVAMYAKCGSLDNARSVFNNLHSKDVVTWTALLNGYAEHSNCQMAMQCFKEMLEEGVQPDDATFACLLVACSHDGLLSEGQQYFRMMVDHGITPTVQHYNCMVDLLARSGRLEEAEKVLRSMPVSSDVVGWTTLLSACKSYGDIERGRRCFGYIVQVEPENATAYVLMANIFANAGRWEDVDSVEDLRRFAGAKKKPAKACIEVHQRVHEFTVGAETPGISGKSRKLNRNLKEEGGYIPHTELVLSAVPEVEKEDALCGHAEKLALAYGLLNTAEGATLLVTKNLRMCNNCHSGTKIMSRLEQREIIVRDAHRVHHFKDGFCSCGDRP